MFIDGACLLLFVFQVPVAHRDLKSSNLVVKSRRECALVDFGLALRLDLSLTVDVFANSGQVNGSRIRYDILYCPRKDICSGLRPAVPHTCTNIINIQIHAHLITHALFEQTQTHILTMATYYTTLMANI